MGVCAGFGNALAEREECFPWLQILALFDPVA